MGSEAGKNQIYSGYQRPKDITDLVVENHTFQQIADFKYLGANI